MTEAPLGPATRALARYLWRYRARYAAGLVCLLAATGLALAIPWTVQRAIEALERDADGAPVGTYAGLVLLLAGAGGLARLASRFAIMGAAQRIEHDLRNDLYASLTRCRPAYFAVQTTGDLMARASSDTGAVRSLTGFGAISLVSTLAAFGGAVSAMLAVDPWLTMWALAPYPALILLGKAANTRIHTQTQAAQDRLGALSACVQEHLAAMSVVRAYALERHAAALFDRASGEYLARSLALARTQAGVVPLAGLVSGLAALVVLWLGGRAVLDGRLTLGALVAFNGYLAYLSWPTLALGFTLSLLRRGLTSLARVHEVIAGAPPVEEAGDELPAGAPPSIRFERLTFAYEGRGLVLRDVTFAVDPGETVAVVGPTGSGKSTLGALLARLWEPPPGTVFLGGRDVTTLRLSSLRAAIGDVPQDGFLFSRPVADNITLGRAEVTADRAAQAAESAGVADEIAGLPRGWETVVGERGLTLSGGQRQRVTLARALAGEPRVLVLDDIFASVDAAKEEEILGRLRAATLGRTALLMTHRLRAAQLADRIIVLAEGRVVESGSHETLLAAGGLYATLWRLQQLEAEIARG